MTWLGRSLLPPQRVFRSYAGPSPWSGNGRTIRLHSYEALRRATHRRKMISRIRLAGKERNTWLCEEGPDHNSAEPAIKTGRCVCFARLGIKSTSLMQRLWPQERRPYAFSVESLAHVCSLRCGLRKLCNSSRLDTIPP